MNAKVFRAIDRDRMVCRLQGWFQAQKNIIDILGKVEFMLTLTRPVYRHLLETFQQIRRPVEIFFE